MQLHRFTPAELRLSTRALRELPHVMATLNVAELTAIRDDEVGRSDRRLVDFKYFNMRPWMFENIRRALRLGLHRERYLRVLDIGTGFGYFPYVCEYMEHEAHAIDIPSHRLYDRVIDALGVQRLTHTVEAFQPLPLPNEPYHYVTAFQIAFNHPNEAGTWGADAWAFFLEDMLAHQLQPGGRLHLELNYSHKNNQWYDRKTATVFDRFGARRRGNTVHIIKT